MEFIAAKEVIYEVKADAIVTAVFAEEKPIGEVAVLDDKMGGMIGKLIEEGEISGKDREFTLIHTDKIGSPRVLVMGLGKRKNFDVDKIRSISGRAGRILRRIKALDIAYSNFCWLEIEPMLAAKCITEGVLLGLYHFKKYITTREPKDAMKKITIIAKDDQEAELINNGIKKGEILAEGTIIARDLSNEPANIMTPTYFAERAAEISSKLNLKLTILDQEEMKKMGMGAFLAVAQGSDEPAKMVILKYSGKPGATTLGLVGKGITFDSGGVNLKNAEQMQRMYTDCSGACAVLGAVFAIARLNLPINVVAVIPLAENMPSGRAFKPGDILKSYSGKTIEILNTDAEGRLILADALTHAQKIGVDYLIDIATLTGGCVIALGYTASGVMSNDDKLVELVKKAGTIAGENMWQLPLFEDYFAQIHSDVADMENSGGPAASTCTAGKFLEQFIDKKPWVHIDIAGTAVIERERTPYLKKPYLPKEGATGVGVRTLFHLAELLSE